MIDDRSAVLLVRVWQEGAEDFRARLTTYGAGDDASVEEATVAVASSPSDVIDAVRAWLDDLLGDDRDVVDNRP